MLKMRGVQNSPSANGVRVMLQTLIGKVTDEMGSAAWVFKGRAMLVRWNRELLARIELLALSGICGIRASLVLKSSTPSNAAADVKHQETAVGLAKPLG